MDANKRSFELYGMRFLHIWIVFFVSSLKANSVELAKRAAAQKISENGNSVFAPRHGRMLEATDLAEP